MVDGTGSAGCGYLHSCISLCVTAEDNKEEVVVVEKEELAVGLLVTRLMSYLSLLHAKRRIVVSLYYLCQPPDSGCCCG